MVRSIFAFAALSLSISATPVLGQSEDDMFSNDEGQIEFVLPSKNIGCTYTPAGGTSVYTPRDNLAELSCSRIEPTYVTVILGTKGAATKIENPGEQGCCSDVQVLAYGKTFSAGSFDCVAKTSGLTCKSRTGHGFTMSRKKVTTY